MILRIIAKKIGGKKIICEKKKMLEKKLNEFKDKNAIFKDKKEMSSASTKNHQFVLIFSADKWHKTNRETTHNFESSRKFSSHVQ